MGDPAQRPDIDTDRARGALLGLAAGDALGTTLEFRAPGSFDGIADMVGGGPFELPAGAWTDDTSMALCLADSLRERRRFDAVDQMQRYVRWREEGYRSSIGRCFDIGVTVRRALQRFEETGSPFAGSTDPYTAGNGALMRLAPVAIAYAAVPRRAVFLAGESSRTTHGARESVDACRLFAALLVAALGGAGKEELLQPTRYRAWWKDRPLAPAIQEVAEGSFLRREPPEIEGSGYVVRSLEAALWAFAKEDGFEAGALRAVNLGDDADTTGAVFGQIAGAAYGAAAIPHRWRERLVDADGIVAVAEALAENPPEDLHEPA